MVLVSMMRDFKTETCVFPPFVVSERMSNNEIMLNSLTAAVRYNEVSCRYVGPETKSFSGLQNVFSLLNLSIRHLL